MLKTRPLTRRLATTGRLVLTYGLPRRPWQDLYHLFMTMSWPRLFISYAGFFALFNLLFAAAYQLQPGDVANLNPPGYWGRFFFSVETLATVGYGDMHPQTNYGHLVATVEIFTGMSFLAVMTGLIFARFSRTRARFLFADHPVVTLQQGRPTLMIRIANARNNTISQATARLWLFRLESMSEGHQLRRYYELKLDRREHPMFSLSWTLFHIIDETSALYGLTPADLATTEAALVVNVSGVDDNSAQPLYARKIYAGRDIRWNYRYRDITSFSAEGRLVLDYSLFHEVAEDPDQAANQHAFEDEVVSEEALSEP